MKTAIIQFGQLSQKKSLAWTAVYVVLAGFCLASHEMWRDELQAWLIAISSGSLSELFANIRYEGHPSGWFLVLFLLSKFSSSAVLMQVVHLAIAAGTVYMVFSRAPFSLFEKVLLITGYFFLYEYGVIARNYNMSVFLIVWICIILKQFPEKNLGLGILLFLLCQTNLYGSLMSVIIAFYLFLSVWKVRAPGGRLQKAVVPLLLTFSGLILFYLQVKPATDVLYNDYYKWNGGFSFERIIYTGSVFFDVYVPVPTFDVANSFGLNFFGGAHFLKLIVSAAFLVFVMYRFRKNASVCITFFAGAVLLLTTLYFNEHTSLRHKGFLFILFVFCLWVYRSGGFTDSVLNKAVVALLCIQTLGGIIAAGKDIRYTFSNLEEAGKFISKKEFSNARIMGMPDYVVSPLAAFLKRPVYVQETENEIWFVTWNDERKESDAALVRLLGRADTLVMTGGEAILVINQGLLDTSHNLLTEAPVGEFTKLVLIRRFDKPSLIGDEKYYFYRVERRE